MVLFVAQLMGWWTVQRVFFIQGFEGTLVWESLDSAGLTTVNSSSVHLNDGGGVLKIASVCTHM